MASKEDDDGCSATSCNIKKSTRVFGSFMVSNVDTLLKQDKIITSFEVDLNGPDIKSDIKLEYNVKKGYLNHGAFGAALTTVRGHAEKIREAMETNPVAFVDKHWFQLSIISLKSICSYIGCNPLKTLFSRNVSECLNICIGSLQSSIKSITILKNCHPITKRLVEMSNLNVVEIDILSTPITYDNLCLHFGEVKTDAIILEHIMSSTGIMLPIQEIVSKLRRDGYIGYIIIDGAHALGTIQIELNNIDFYTTSTYKWFSNVKGCSLMMFSDRMKLLMENYNHIVSLGVNSGFHSKYLWTGTDDRVAWLTMPFLCKIWSVSFKHYMEDLQKLKKYTLSFLETEWKTKPLTDDFRLLSSMICFELPIFGNTYNDAEKIQNKLSNENIEVSLKAFNSKLWVRISLAPYTTIDDIKLLSSAVLKLSNQLSKTTQTSPISDY
jgi:selenocysteine lyase/cysteine desulfurase